MTLSSTDEIAAESHATALAVPEGDARGDSLPVRAAARAAGLSESTLRRLIQDGVVDAVRDGGGALRVRQTTVVELRSGGGRTRAPSVGVRHAEAARGALAAQCFGLFDAGTPLEAIVVRLEVEPTIVRSLFSEWSRCREISERFLSGEEAR